MRIASSIGRSKTSLRSIRASAFTLLEVHVSMAILIFVVGIAMMGHVFGMRLFQTARLKLTATDAARVTLGKMREEIRSAASVIVGTAVTVTNVLEIGDNTNQVGNALVIYPGTNTDNYIVYFRKADQTIRRWSTSDPREDLLAGSITNQAVFSARDYNGNVLTNNENNRVIQIDLQFFQHYGEGGGGLSDYYQLRTKATRRLVQ